MKIKNLFISIIFIFIMCITITGCGNNNLKNVEPNQKVGLVKYYVPEDYQNRNDLRGLFYSEENRKVYAKGDTNDYSTFFYIDMIKSSSNGQKLGDYINDVNTNNLKEGDVKLKKFDNEHILVYAREGYEIKKGGIEIINYAYITQVDDSSFYTLTISGPKSNIKEIEEIAKKSAYSLQK